MGLLNFAQVILRRWWLPTALGLLGVAVAIYLHSSAPKRYQSSINLQLNPAAKSAFLPYVTTADAGPVASLAASYREVLRSRSFGEVVVDRLGLDVAPEAIAGSTSVVLIPSTNILRLTVIWDNPSDAQQLAQSIAEVFIAENLQRQQAQPGGQFRLTELEESTRALQNRIAPLRQQRERLDQAIARGDLSRLGEMAELDTRLSQLETSYANLLVEVNRIRSGLDTAAILDTATRAAPVATMPLIQAILIGLLAGAGLGIVLALLLERHDDTVRTPEDVITIAGAAPLAAVGRITVRGKQHKFTRESPRLVTIQTPRAQTAESFRTLRTNLHFAALQQPLRAIVVTSPGPGEGKSLVASNLAVILAQSGKRVILWDADLRRPSVHKVFGLENQRGYLDAISQLDARLGVAAGAYSPNGHRPEAPISTPEEGLLDGIVPGPVEGLHILPSGRLPSNPSELLNSEATVRLLDWFTAHWDIVIVDSAPVGPVADALILAAKTDGVLLIARSAQTQRPALIGALEGLRQAGKPILGVVLNDLQAGPLSRYTNYAYYYGYYGKAYYEEDGAETKRNGRSNGKASHETNGAVPRPQGAVAEHPGASR